MTADEKKLSDLIEQQLDKACKTNLPRLCDLIERKEGRQTALSMIFSYCKLNGVSVQTAMAVIDSEL